jgi:hypothetical protein
MSKSVESFFDPPAIMPQKTSTALHAAAIWYHSGRITGRVSGEHPGRIIGAPRQAAPVQVYRVFNHVGLD